MHRLVLRFYTKQSPTMCFHVSLLLARVLRFTVNAAAYIILYSIERNTFMYSIANKLMPDSCAIPAAGSNDRTLSLHLVEDGSLYSGVINPFAAMPTDPHNFGWFPLTGVTTKRPLTFGATEAAHF